MVTLENPQNTVSGPTESDRFPPLRGGKPVRGPGNDWNRRSRNRQEIVERATTRIEGDRFPFSPFWLVAVRWPAERCPTCRRPLPEETIAAYDEDELAMFCLGCAHRWLEAQEDDDKGGTA
jgi:hypothetical protein